MDTRTPFFFFFWRTYTSDVSKEKCKCETVDSSPAILDLVGGRGQTGGGDYSFNGDKLRNNDGAYRHLVQEGAIA